MSNETTITATTAEGIRLASKSIAEWAISEVTACAEAVAQHRAAKTLTVARAELLDSAVRLARSAGVDEKDIEDALNAGC